MKQTNIHKVPNIELYRNDTCFPVYYGQPVCFCYYPIENGKSRARLPYTSVLFLCLAQFALTKATQCCSNCYRKNITRKKDNSYKNTV